MVKYKCDDCGKKEKFTAEEEYFERFEIKLYKEDGYFNHLCIECKDKRQELLVNKLKEEKERRAVKITELFKSLIDKKEEILKQRNLERSSK